MKQWPTDPQWRKFAAHIADAVTVHLAKGGSITTTDAVEHGRCPLGAATGYFHPPSSWAAALLIVPSSWTYGFIYGFDIGGLPRGHEPSFRLGLEYRKRFVQGA